MLIPLSVLPNPYEINYWGAYQQLSKDLVSRCLEKGLQKTLPLFADEDHTLELLHAMRVAYFVSHGWLEPIEVRVQYTPEGEPYAWCQDGVHRLSAALYLGHTDILAIYDESVESFIKGLT